MRNCSICGFATNIEDNEVDKYLTTRNQDISKRYVFICEECKTQYCGKCAKTNIEIYCDESKAQIVGIVASAMQISGKEYHEIRRELYSKYHAETEEVYNCPVCSKHRLINYININIKRNT